MALNPQLQESQTTVPSGLAYSKGADSDRSAASKGMATGTTLTGIGQTIGALADTADTVVKEQIYGETARAVDDVRKLFGVDAATENVSGGIPSGEMTKAQNDLTRLNEAYQSGAVKQSTYFAKLNVITKSLKARYPGYEKEIDATISGITGVNPANALVSSLYSEAQADKASRDAEANKWQTYVQNNADWITRAFPNYFDLPEGERPSRDVVLKGVSQLQAQDSVITSRNLQLENDLKEGNATHKDLIKQANDIAGTRLNQIMTGSFSTLGNSYQDIVKKINELQQNPELKSAEEIQQLQMSTAQLVTQFKASVNAELSTGPYAQLSAQERKDVLDGATNQLQVLVDAINNDDYGLVKANAALVEAQKSEAAATLLQKPGMRNLATVRDLFPDYFPILMGSDPEGLNAVTTTLKNFIIGDVGTGNIGTNTGQTNLNSAIDSTAPVSPQAPKVIIQSNLDIIKDPKAPTELVINAGKFLFGPGSEDAIGKFKESQRASIFSQFYSPDVTAAMQKAGKANPDVWKMYQQSAATAFMNSSRETMANIKELPLEYMNLVDIEFDRTSGQFVVRPSDKTLQQNTGSLTGIAGTAPDPYATSVAQDEIIRQYQDLNKLLLSLKPIVEAEGNDFGTNVEVMLQALGVPYGNPLSPDERQVKPDLTKLQQEGIDPAINNLLTFVQGFEAPAGFNSMYGDVETASLNLSQLTIDEVIAEQGARVKAGSPSSAAGGLQILRDNLAGLKKELGLTGNEYFSEDMQRIMGLALLERRGLSKFLSGDISADKFANNLAGEWAALPLANGKSVYESKLNHALTDRQSVLDQLTLLKEGYSGKKIGPIIPMQGNWDVDVSKFVPEYQKGGVYSNIPEAERDQFMAWNNDPIANSDARLGSVDVNLQAVIKRAEEISGVKFVVGSGTRTEADQRLAMSLGWSKTMKSDHMEGGAADLWALDESGAVSFEESNYVTIAAAMKQAAAELGVDIEWGGDWKSFRDIPHFAVKGEVHLPAPAPDDLGTSDADYRAWKDAEEQRAKDAASPPPEQITKDDTIE